MQPCVGRRFNLSDVLPWRLFLPDLTIRDEEDFVKIRIVFVIVRSKALWLLYSVSIGGGRPGGICGGAAFGCFLIVRPQNIAIPGSAIRRIRAPYRLKCASVRISPWFSARTIRKRTNLRRCLQIPSCLPLPRYRLNAAIKCLGVNSGSIRIDV